MKVLIVHTRYVRPGGEDVIVDIQHSVLSARGHAVVRFERDNSDLDVDGPVAQVRTALHAVWSRRSQRDLTSVLAAERPDIVHVHNTFPSLSPSVYAAANAAGVPVVQHLHNARLVCIDPCLVRDGRVCTDCVGRRIPWPGLVHRCYRGSIAESGVAAAVQVAHHSLGTWARRVDLFLPVSAWLRDLLVDSGAVPASKVLVCHSALDPDPGLRPAPRPDRPDGGYALFAGRLAPEKGLDTLLEAAARVRHLPVKIAGEGPERALLETMVRRLELDHVELLGQVDRPRLLDLLRGARVAVVPSLGDALNMSAVEAAASGVPVVGSLCGGIPEVVADGVTGHLVAPGDPAALASRLAEAAAEPERMWEMGAAGRVHFEERFTATVFGDRLLTAYATAISNAAAAGRARGYGRVGRPHRLSPTDVAPQLPPGP
jgi:glycosyltransferase involved in cell wall biosynthesis